MQFYPSTLTHQRQHPLRLGWGVVVVMVLAWLWGSAASAQQATPAPQPAAPAAQVIALLLPLSGPDSATGKALLDAATLALYDMQRNKPLDRPVPVVRLLPKDTKGEAAVAQEIVRDLLEKPETKPAAILGPLFSRELEAILPLVRDADVPLIGLSNNPALAGRGAYQFNYFAAEQAERLAAYAASQGVKSVAAIASADGYGRQVMDQLAKALKPYGIAYGPTVLLPAGLLLAPDALAGMIPTLKNRRSQRQLLFIAEQSPRLDGIVLALAKARALSPNLVLAGTGMWDDPRQLASPALRGAIFVSTPRKGYEQFARKYETTYGSYPPRVASIAYDAVALLTSLIYQGGPEALSDATLQSTNGFVTPANGLVRLRDDGMAERRLAVYLANGAGSARVLVDAADAF